MPYVLEGQRWASQPISWDFASSTLPGDQSKPFSNTITEQNDETVIEQAFEDWSRAAGLQFVYAPQDNASVDIRIGWGSFAAGTTDTELGETDYTYYSATDNFVPDTLIRLLDPSLSPLADINGTLTYTHYDVTLFQVVLHEIGHSIGLAHDTVDQNAIMYPYASTQNRQLAAPDINGAQAIYGPPGVGTVDIGANQETVSGSLAGPPATILGGTGTLDYAGWTGLIVMQDGDGSIQDGTVTVFAGAGVLSAANNTHGLFILANGPAAITGGAKGTTDIVFGGTGTFSYAGASEAASVIGGTGSATITGGAGGGFYSGGSDGNNSLTATGIGTVLVGGGNNDTLQAAPTGYDYLVAGAGNETLIGAGGGTDRFYLGSGADQVTLGAGSSQLVTGAGTATITGASGNAALFVGTGGADLFIAKAGASIAITGFRQGTDQIGATPASITATGGNTVLHFANGATITLNGVTDPSGSGLIA